MANPHKGEVEFKGPDGKTYLLKFTNSGRVAVENELDMEAPEISGKMDKGGPGPRIITALFYGATRKYHARDVPNMARANQIMDEIEVADDDIENADDKIYLDLVFSVMAAYLRIPKKELLDRAAGVNVDEEEEGKEEPTTEKPKKTKAA